MAVFVKALQEFETTLRNEYHPGQVGYDIHGYIGSSWEIIQWVIQAMQSSSNAKYSIEEKLLNKDAFKKSIARATADYLEKDFLKNAIETL